MIKRENKVVQWEDPDLPVGYLSVSSAQMYQKCPKQYEFRYVLGKKSPPTVSLVEGSTYHLSMSADNERKRDTKGKESLNYDEMVNVFMESFKEGKREIEDWESDTENSVYSRSKLVIGRYVNEVQSKVNSVTAVEEEFRVTIGEGEDRVPVLGYIDLVCGWGDLPKVLIDYKFSNRKMEESDVSHHTQLAIYHIVTGVKSVGIIRNERKEKGVVEATVVKSVDKQTVAMAKDLMVHVARGVKAGAFPPTDSGNWWCSPKWCGYYGMCRGCKASTTRIVKRGGK